MTVRHYLKDDEFHGEFQTNHRNAQLYAIIKLIMYFTGATYQEVVEGEPEFKKFRKRHKRQRNGEISVERKGLYKKRGPMKFHWFHKRHILRVCPSDGKPLEPVHALEVGLLDLHKVISVSYHLGTVVPAIHLGHPMYHAVGYGKTVDIEQQ